MVVDVAAIKKSIISSMINSSVKISGDCKKRVKRSAPFESLFDSPDFLALT